MEGCSRIKDGNGRLAQGEDEVRRIWKEYFEDLYNIDAINLLSVVRKIYAGILVDRVRRGGLIDD